MTKVAFTAGRVNGFKCPPEKKQAFLWDAMAPGLGLRVTPAGRDLLGLIETVIPRRRRVAGLGGDAV